MQAICHGGVVELNYQEKVPLQYLITNNVIEPIDVTRVGKSGGFEIWEYQETGLVLRSKFRRLARHIYIDT